MSILSVTLHKTILKHNLEEHNYYVRKPAKRTIVKRLVLRVEVSKKCMCVKGRVWVTCMEYEIQ